jgi:hypothetical protein
LILCEVLQGIPSDQQAARVLRGLRHFEIFDTGSVELALLHSDRDFDAFEQALALRVIHP